MKKIAEIIETLTSGPQYTVSNLPKDMPTRGVFVVLIKDKIIYVGKSGKLRKGIYSVCFHANSHLARSLTRNHLKLKVTYDGGPLSKKSLMENPEFMAVYARKRKLLSKAKTRFVEIADDLQYKVIDGLVKAALNIR